MTTNSIFEWLLETLIQNIVMLGAILTMLICLFKTGQWTGIVNARLDHLEKRFDSFENRITEKLESIFRLLPRPVFEGQSPVRLTDFGREISKTASAAEWAKTQVQDQVDLEKATGKQEFEIYDLCFGHVSAMFDDADDRTFSDIVRKGAYDCGTSTDVVPKVYQIELRDALTRTIEEG